MGKKFQEFIEWEYNQMIGGYSRLFGHYFVHISFCEHVVGYGYMIQLPDTEVIYPGDGQQLSWPTLVEAKVDAECRIKHLPEWLEQRTQADGNNETL